MRMLCALNNFNPLFIRCSLSCSKKIVYNVSAALIELSQLRKGHAGYLYILQY